MFQYRYTVIAAIVLGLTSTPCLAGAGDLDPTFGNGGLVTTDFMGSNQDRASDVVAVQCDGKIVVVGQSWQPGNDFAMARYHPDGSLDSSFGNAGTVTTDFDGVSGATAVAIQADGKIVAAGWSWQPYNGYNFALARYNTDGSLDGSFGTGGLVTKDFDGDGDVVTAVEIQADGKIVAAGWSSQQGTGYDFALARYNTDGNLDVSFGTGGLVTTDFDGGRDEANAVAIQADGKIVATGWSWRQGTGWDFALARYNTDGSLDGSFGTGGLVTTDFGSSLSDYGLGVALQADGKIVAAGWSWQPGNDYDFALARYNTDGSLDGSFGTGGLATTDFGYSNDGASAVAIQADGKIVAAGWSWPPSNDYDFALARYNTDGSLDVSFGTGDLVTTDFDGDRDEATAVVIQCDGKIVVVGHSDKGSPTGSDFALARYNTDGSLDGNFGSSGLVTTDFLGSSNNESAREAVAVQADGKIVVVWTTSTYAGGGTDFAMARYHPDGSLDSSFGNAGTVTTDFDGGSDGAYAVTIQADGKIVAAGWSWQQGTGNDYALARYNTDGSLDVSFGTGGLVTTDFGYSNDWAYAVALQADGKIVAAGWSPQQGTGNDFALARYNTDGSLDGSFGTGGLVTTEVDGGWDVATAVAIQADGKIVAAGWSWQQGTGYDFALARYNTDGSLDGSFGSGGLVTTDFGSDWAYGVAIQVDGKIVAAGYSNADFALARYNTDGSLDGSFGSGGLVTTDFDGGPDVANAVTIQADGKIVAAGRSRQQGTGNDFALARYNTDGSLDGGFGTGGLVTTDFGYSNDWAYAVAIQADGKIVAAGLSNQGFPTQGDLALARYDGGIVATCDPIPALLALIDEVLALNLQHGIENALDAKLDAALAALIDEIFNNDDAAVNALGAFINHTEAQSGQHIPVEDADLLIDEAQSVIDQILCGGD